MHTLLVICLVAAYLAANVYAIVKVRVFESLSCSLLPARACCIGTRTEALLAPPFLVDGAA